MTAILHDENNFTHPDNFCFKCKNNALKFVI